MNNREIDNLMALLAALAALAVALLMLIQYGFIALMACVGCFGFGCAVVTLLGDPPSYDDEDEY